MIFRRSTKEIITHFKTAGHIVAQNLGYLSETTQLEGGT